MTQQFKLVLDKSFTLMRLILLKILAKFLKFSNDEIIFVGISLNNHEKNLILQKSWLSFKKIISISTTPSKNKPN